MLLIGTVVILGLVLGLVSGGRVRSLAELRLRWWPLAIVGLGLQLLPVPHLGGTTERWVGVALLIASYVVLLVFLAVNIEVPGFPIIAVGFALNLLVISVNGGMPVTDQALRQAYGTRYRAERAYLLAAGGAKHHLARPHDELLILADRIPIGPPFRQVASAGDLLFFAGVIWVLVAGTRGPRGRHRARRGPRAARGLGSGRGPVAAVRWPTGRP